MNSDAVMDPTASMLVVKKKPSPAFDACKGIFPDYRKNNFQTKINVFILYVIISDTAVYKAGVGSLNCTNLFHKNCSGSGKIQYTKIDSFHACDS